MSAVASIASFVKNPPASEADLAKLRASLPGPAPDDWLAILRVTNGGEGYVGEDFVRLYSTEQVAKVKETLAPVEVPGVVLIGSTGGGTAYTYDYRGGGALEHLRVAEEEGGVGVGGGAPDLVDATMLDDPAGSHHRQPVGDGERLLVVVGDHECGDPLLGEDRAQIGGEPLPEAGVERGERFVEEQQPGPYGEAAGQRHPLALAA